ncbi:glycosyltransferase family 4 protein [Puia dinghuensis]|uniref:Glycosyl transferase n=1 Tax=Puia dinghuensis TaxID=1792502 RepID=A0A8J2XUA2_9BACT|nr:glycosyltransferase family 4 protein [Puia dinghuensis]GGB24191.1 glycosyl transferase [Puia dinghuensis]
MRKKIHILYGLEAADSGALKHLTYLATNLDQTIFEITVILSTRRSTEYAYRHIMQMRRSKIRVIVIPMERNIHFGKDIVSFWAIFSHLVQNQYDIVHAHSSKAGVLFRVAAWMARVPAIFYTPHCFYFQGKSGIKRAVYSAIERWMGAITDHIVVSNNERDAAMNYNIAGSEKLLNINNAIDFEEYKSCRRKEILKRAMGLQENALVVGAVGRLVEQKDWLTYIYAAKDTIARFPEAVFLIVGEGELREYLQDTIDFLGMTDKIIITGYYAEIAEIYSVIDIYVSTSLWEGLPYVLLEAMWFRKPVVATDLGYSDLIQERENGFLVTRKDYSLIAKRIGQLIQDQALRQRMGEKGHQRVSRLFTFQKFVRSHEKAYLQLFSNGAYETLLPTVCGRE